MVGVTVRAGRQPSKNEGVSGAGSGIGQGGEGGGLVMRFLTAVRSLHQTMNKKSRPSPP